MSHVEPWLTDYLPQPGTGLALDIGANEGDWTKALAERSTEVHAFEPNPQVLPALRVNMSPYRNVRLFDLAVGATVGSLELDLYEKSEWATAYHADELDAWRAGEPLGSVDVPIHTLDLLGYDGRHVEFIKVDVEGGECDVLLGGRRMLDKHRPRLLVEIHSAANREWVVGFLGDLGYETEGIVLRHPHEGVSEGHCWVVAA